MFKNFCHCNAAISDLYNCKSKNKIAVIFFPNSHGWTLDQSLLATSNKWKAWIRWALNQFHMAIQITHVVIYIYIYIYIY